MPHINSCFTAISHIQIFPYAQTTGISSGKQIYVVYLPINWGGFGDLRLVFWQVSCSLTCTQLTKCQGCFWCCCCYRIRCPCLRRGVARQAEPGNYSCCSCSASSFPLPPTPLLLCARWKHPYAPLLNLSEKSSLVLGAALLSDHWILCPCQLKAGKAMGEFHFTDLSSLSSFWPLGSWIDTVEINTETWLGLGEEKCINSKARNGHLCKITLEAGLGDLLTFLLTWIILDNFCLTSVLLRTQVKQTSA